MANLLFALLLCWTWILAMPAFASRVTSLPRPLDEEAEQAADTFVAAHFNFECGEDVFSHTGGLYWQYRDLGWSVRSDPLTYKDKVFGVEWKGQLEIGAEQFRTYRSRGWILQATPVESMAPAGTDPHLLSEETRSLELP